MSMRVPKAKQKVKVRKRGEVLKKHIFFGKNTSNTLWLKRWVLKKIESYLSQLSSIVTNEKNMPSVPQKNVIKKKKSLRFSARDDF